MPNPVALCHLTNWHMLPVGGGVRARMKVEPILVAVRYKKREQLVLPEYYLRVAIPFSLIGQSS